MSCFLLRYFKKIVQKNTLLKKKCVLVYFQIQTSKLAGILKASNAIIYIFNTLWRIISNNK